MSDVPDPWQKLLDRVKAGEPPAVARAEASLRHREAALPPGVTFRWCPCLDEDAVGGCRRPAEHAR